MNLRKLNDDQIIFGLHSEIKKEKQTTANVVRYIDEVDRRKLYLNYKCTSIFQYLLTVEKYDNSSAQRRIDAMKLLRQLPEIEMDLEKGSINLTQTAQFTTLVREKEKTVGKLELEQKRELVDAIRGKTTAQTQVLLCQLLEIEPKQLEKAKPQAEESVRREATFTKEQEAILQQVREQFSHVHINPSFADLVMAMAEIVLKKPNSTFAAKVKSENPRYIADKIKAKLLKEQKGCQWEHAPGELCGSRFQLQVDHIVPVYKGGTNDVENLQLLCAQHNRLKYRQGM